VPEPGQVLTCSQGTWSGAAAQSYAMRWSRDGVAIATSSAYTVVAGDQGHTLTCTVTATNGDGSAAASASVAVAAFDTRHAPLGFRDTVPAAGRLTYRLGLSARGHVVALGQRSITTTGAGV
jgi:hypothetical protein